VVTDVGALPELVADGSGEVVAPEDPAALAAALVRVLATPGLAERLGGRAAAGAAESSWPRVAERTLEAYARHLSR
jgi:glycosyltransferase involved in cell wall biosynthesis